MPTISTDKAKLDTAFIHEFLAQTYWAKERSIAEVQLTIDHSLCFGLYVDEKQAGFARVVTDYVTFAYLMDVFVVEQHRGKGFASQLMDAILKEPALSRIKTWRLATSDAHALYRKFGFTGLRNPEKLMEKLFV